MASELRQPEAAGLSLDDLICLPTVNVIPDPLRRFHAGGGWWWVGRSGSIFVKCWAPDQAHPGRRPRAHSGGAEV